MSRNAVVIGCVLAVGGAVGSSQPVKRDGPATVIETAAKPLETVLDRKVHIEPDLVLDVPKVRPLCDLVDVERRRVSVGDCELYCETEGEGMPLVLLHGGPGATHHYFHPSFSRAARFARVIYYDQRGCGQSDYHPGKGYTLDQAVDDLDALRKSLGVDRWVVLGHSYGGIPAQLYAMRYPDRVAGLVLVASSTTFGFDEGPSREGEIISDKERARMAEIRRATDLTSMQRAFNSDLNGAWKFQHFHKPTRDHMARWARYEWNHDTGFNDIIGTQTRQLALRGAFTGCPIPTLMVEGKWDLSWGVNKPREMERAFPAARMVILEASSHDPFDAEPEAFFSLLGEFMAGLDEVSPSTLAAWKRHTAPWLEKHGTALESWLSTMGWGRSSSVKIAERYSVAWLEELDDLRLLIRAGFALYDVERYEEALQVFRRLESAAVTAEGSLYQGIGLVWQGHMLDLLGRREEAVATYQKAVDLNETGKAQSTQYGLVYRPGPYAAKRIETPFKRVENSLE